jgi:hypothetical protein
MAYRLAPERHATASMLRPFAWQTSLRVINAHAMRAILFASATGAAFTHPTAQSDDRRHDRMSCRRW